MSWTEIDVVPDTFVKIALKIANSSSLHVFAQLWRVAQRLIGFATQEGMYELLDYEAHLEIKDVNGKLAVAHKRQRVRFLQNNIFSFQDMAWGDGAIFAGYRCSPGVEVDRYDEGHRWWVLISLRESKNRGDVEEFSIDRTIRDGFRRTVESFQTEIIWRTRRLVTTITFPKGRPPKRVKLIEQNSNRTIALGPGQLHSLPDGRVQALWETDRPRLFEAYILQWVW